MMPTGAPPNKMKAALLGGLVAGVLSGLPGISAGNCCFCLWVVLGGVIAAYLYTKEVPLLRSGEAAFVGMMSGVVAAVIATIISIPLRLLMSRFMMGFQREFMEKMLEQNQDFPPQLREFMLGMFSPGFAIGMILVGFVMSLVFFSIFGALGGMLGNAMFKKKA